MLPKLPTIGRVVTHDDIEEIVAYLRAITPIVTGGANVAPHVTPSGTWFEAAGGGGGGGLIPMITPAGGLPAGGAADCTFRVLSGTSLVAGSEAATVYNRTAYDPGALKPIWCTRLGGLLFFVILEECPA